MTYPPYGAPPPPPPPGRPRPRARWFVVGALLLVLAVVAFAGGLFWTLSPLAREDAVIEAGAGPVEVDLPAGETRALFMRSGEPADCTVVDADGERLELEPVAGRFTSGEWTAEAGFGTGAGDVVLDCEARAGTEVRVGQVPSAGAFVAGLLLTVLAPIVLGLAGIVVLVVTAVLWGTRSPRPPLPR